MAAASNAMAAASDAMARVPPIPDHELAAMNWLNIFLKIIWSEVDEIESSSCQTDLDLEQLDSLKHMAHNVEDTIADYEWQVRFPSSCDAIPWEATRYKLRRFSKRFQLFKYSSESLKITNEDGKVKASHDGFSRQPTGSIPYKNGIVGVMREFIEDISNSIASIQTGSKQIAIFPVLGPAGTRAACTTVVQHVYRSSLLKEYFKLMGWVSMPESFDELEFARSVYESMVGTTPTSSDLKDTWEELKGEVDGKRFLIVLDSVQTKQDGLWESLWTLLASLQQGGVLMILIQDLNVCTEMKNITQWHVEAPFVFEPQELEMIDQKIKSEGRPFPMKVHVLSDFQSTYRLLSLPLRRCIAYCSLFPDSHKFDKAQLIRHWIAEGFIHTESERDKTLEEIGSNYFDDLLWKFCFAFSQDYRFVIPFPLQNALLSTSEYLRIMGGNAIATHSSPHVRYASYVAENHNSEINYDLQYEARRLRTFIVISNEYKSRIDLSLLSKMNYLRTVYLCYVDITELPESLGGLKHLRLLGLFRTGVKLLPNSVWQLYNLQTLDLSYSRIDQVPEGIGKLKQLRFLGLNGTLIRILPDSICELQHLQTLELMNCPMLEELPRNMRDMTSLRHLRIDSDSNFCMPAKLEELVELQTLQRFHVSQADGYAGIKELKGLGNISGELNISGLCNVKDPNDCNEADLKSKQFIEKLTLNWSSQVGEQDKEESDNDYYDEELSDKDSEGIDLPNGEQHEEVCNVAHTNAMGDITSNQRQPTVQHQSNAGNLEPTFAEIIEEADTSSSSLYVAPKQQGSPERVEQVLCNLKPHDSLLIFVVESYHGTEFPQWLGDESFKKLWSVVLTDCKNCNQLPSLGLLPRLRYLTIDHMSIPKFCLGIEDLPDKKRFPELQDLCFKRLYELEEWIGVKDVDFPKLEYCLIFNCPKLRAIPCFVSLKTLEMENCGALAELPEVPMLETLRLIACDGLVNLPNLQELRNMTMMYCKSLVTVPILPLLENLWIEDCDQLKSLDLLNNCSCTVELHEKLERFRSFSVINCSALAYRSDKKLPVAFNKDMLLHGGVLSFNPRKHEGKGKSQIHLFAY